MTKPESFALRAEVPFGFTNQEIGTHVRQMDQQESGPWWVWGDSKEPYLKDVDFNTMKKYVDEGQASGQLDLYGENTVTGDSYEGGE